MQLTYLRYDLYRYIYPTDDVSRVTMLSKIKTLLLTQGVWATTVYRIRRWAQYECGSPAVRAVMKIVGGVLQLLVELTTGITIETSADIGPGLYIGHYGNIFIGGDVTIGKLVNISQEVSVGYGGRGQNWGRPRRIGDCVYIAPGAKIVGEDHYRKQRGGWRQFRGVEVDSGQRRGPGSPRPDHQLRLQQGFHPVQPREEQADPRRG